MRDAGKVLDDVGHAGAAREEKGRTSLADAF